MANQGMFRTVQSPGKIRRSDPAVAVRDDPAGLGGKLKRRNVMVGGHDLIVLKNRVSDHL